MRQSAGLAASATTCWRRYDSAQLIMRHYRARNPARADAAIDKLVAFLSQEGFS
ncbi:MAG: hypothetical protein R3D82_06480 [Xanthobacteraceae bacterium]